MSQNLHPYRLLCSNCSEPTARLYSYNFCYTCHTNRKTRMREAIFAAINLSLYWEGKFIDENGKLKLLKKQPKVYTYEEVVQFLRERDNGN